ncbi:hypothetical protein LUZ63_010447 [Rhynchospora breviuscula]|uniref:Uncharacterized protein n=1 Tax=Rhynchospora breviuscula TaxID=2022672 RepID=A0A9Q0HPK9_9POAL|nr:hypothetical protein LUZ63_010447 [Rhynchospora breviuscula]
MKLRINKACDLSSISVLPPRRTGGLNSSQGASQLRSLSQQSFSQGMSQTQLSQFDESLISDQRLGSNDSSSKIAPPFPSTTSCVRDESQMQLSRVAPNVAPRWNPSSARDNRCQISEEIDQRLRHLENTFSRNLGTVQDEVIQLRGTLKELLHETDGIRQKMSTSDSSLQQILKAEENIKAFIAESIKNIPAELTKNSNITKLNEISSQISAIPEQIQANFSKLHKEIIRLFSRETEVIIGNINSLSSRQRNPIQASVNQAVDDSNPLVQDFLPVTKPLATNPIGPTPNPAVIKIEEAKQKLLQIKPTSIRQTSRPQRDDNSVRQKQNNFINLDSDEEKDKSAPAPLVLKNETDNKESFWMKEDMDDSSRILREARKRKRRQMRNFSRHDAQPRFIPTHQLAFDIV